ncbi:MAG: hypothetical protein HXY30_03445 [Pseudorhodoplanes sp.]|nr:hypothetical protein [Pseudorhodoplanes sp.]
MALIAWLPLLLCAAPALILRLKVRRMRFALVLAGFGDRACGRVVFHGVKRARSPLLRASEYRGTI